MKKLLSILCVVIVLATFSSCKKNYYTEVSPNETVYADVTSSQWQLYSDSKSYYASIDVNDLSGDFANVGGVVVSISYDGGSTYEQLPEVYNGTSYSYTYNKGNVSIYAQSSDGAVAVKPTDAIKVKIILVTSN